MSDARRAVEDVARGAYGRLVAYLASRWRDVASAEDALADALRAALETWPEQGVPDAPDAWLLATAKRRLVDRSRRAAVRAEHETELRMLGEESAGVRADVRIPDERLALLFVCAHPAIDRSVRTPLMMQVVLGIDAARIASAFLVSPATMGQRLVRAKAKIRDAGIAFEVPEPSELPARLGAVLEAIYAAYGTAWEDASGADPRARGLADEAIWLARVVVSLAPREAEPRGLLALMLHCEARRAARRGPAGEYVPLAEQDPARWSLGTIVEAERVLREAAALGAIGPFQLEAAIQSVHARRAFDGVLDREALIALHDALVLRVGTQGTRVARAAALVEAGRADEALGALDELDGESTRAYQPYWAVRAEVLARLGRADEARAAYERAIGLASEPAVRAWLASRRDRIEPR